MARVYNVSYDLKKPGQDYSKLFEELKRTVWWHYLDSTWLIDTTETADQVWERLNRHMDQNDNILIIEVTSNYSGWLPEKAWDWIREHVQRRAA